MRSIYITSKINKLYTYGKVWVSIFLHMYLTLPSPLENLALSQETNKQADHNNSLIQNITSANFSDDVTTLASLSPIRESNLPSHFMSELQRCGSLLIHKSFIKWLQSEEVARCKSDIDFKYKGRECSEISEIWFAWSLNKTLSDWGIFHSCCAVTRQEYFVLSFRIPCV